MQVIDYNGDGFVSSHDYGRALELAISSALLPFSR